VTALTLEEARERSRLLDVRAYRVELDVTGGGEAFGGALTGSLRRLLADQLEDLRRSVAVRSAY
jgi:hypothetical protein